ncbi:FUSC family protein [Nocardioides daejeonensis]|uniref:FUSC family protein n=1 Tax=Nocardioides daejeonensis TaxID=1046556 RepID=UPI000D74F028|nr:FUSC family protein [Nocardioides daejeonensis]
MGFTAAIRANSRPPALQLVKTAVATVLAWVVCSLTIHDGPPPIFAAIAAMLVVQPSLNQSLTKAIERSVGAIAGVVLASALGIAFGHSAVVVLSAVASALALAWVLRMTTGSGNQVAISALLVMVMGATTPGYAGVRVLETIIGAAIGIVVHLALVPPVAVEPARLALDELGGEIAASQERLARALLTMHSRRELDELLMRARRMRPLGEAAESALDDLEDSLALNPRRHRHRDELVAMRESLHSFMPIVTQTLGMTRAFVDQYEDELATEPAVQGIAEELRRAAHDIRRELRLTLAVTYPTFADTDPALTAPLRLKAPKGTRWILVGSLMEDLRRIRMGLGARP